MATTNVNEKDLHQLGASSGYNSSSGSNLASSLQNQQYIIQGQNAAGMMNSGAAKGSAMDSGASGSIFVGIDQFANIDYQTIKAASDTLKRNPNIEFSRNDLLRLLSYLEGELQARDVVVATLKSEKMRNYAHSSPYSPLELDDPHAALFRDSLATSGNIASRQSSTMAAQAELEIRMLADHHLETLEQVILQQRQTQGKMINVLREAENKHKKLVQELDEERRKHERDTAEGDDIAYGLELERTKLKKDLETEKASRKKLEADLKKVQETLDNERARQKQIVLLLLAERKKIIRKYVEERKRSEDLAQILSEEKLRVDSIAEGLEEESKKSLRMEAELEKQAHEFEMERKVLILDKKVRDDQRAKEKELELAQLRAENETLRKQVAPVRLGQPVSIPQPPMKRSDGTDEGTSASPMMSSVAKVVQPTATVSSVPVSGPTTGIARSISPGQGLRQTSLSENVNFNTSKQVPVRKLSNTSMNPPQGIGSVTGGGIISSSQATTSQPIAPNTATPLTSTSKTATLGHTSSPTPQPPMKKMLVSSNVRGVPPPIPPNKPVVPPKRESSASRLGLSNNKEKDTYSNQMTVTSSSSSSSIGGGSSAGGSEVLDDEIQDFQQVLCSMTNK